MSGENEGTSEKDKNNEQLNLKVIGQDGEIVQFKIKRSTPFRKLINAYCDRSRLSASTVRFMFDGNRINDTDTPKSMDMEEDDTIEVFTQQSGGGENLEDTNETRQSALSFISETFIYKRFHRTTNVIHSQQNQKHLTRSKYRRKKLVDIS